MANFNWKGSANLARGGGGGSTAPCTRSAQSTGNARSHRHRTDRTTTARTRGVTNDGSGVAGAFRVGQRFAREHECHTAARGLADRVLRQRVPPPQRTATLRRGCALSATRSFGSARSSASFAPFTTPPSSRRIGGLAQ